MSVPLVFVEKLELFDSVIDGAAKWEPDHSRLHFICPCGCKGYIALPVTPISPTGWVWDGNVEKPSITPSILNYNCKWHGYLTKGEFVQC